MNKSNMYMHGLYTATVKQLKGKKQFTRLVSIEAALTVPLITLAVQAFV